MTTVRRALNAVRTQQFSAPSSEAVEQYWLVRSHLGYIFYCCHLVNKMTISKPRNVPCKRFLSLLDTSKALLRNSQSNGMSVYIGIMPSVMCPLFRMFNTDAVRSLINSEVFNHSGFENTCRCNRPEVSGVYNIKFTVSEAVIDHLCKRELCT